MSKVEKYSIKVLTFAFPFGQSERPSERKLRVPPLCRVPSASSNPRNLDEKKKKRKQRRGTLNAFKRERFDVRLHRLCRDFVIAFPSSIFARHFPRFSHLFYSHFIFLYSSLLCVHTWCVHVDNEFRFFSSPERFQACSLEEIFSLVQKSLTSFINRIFYR